MSIEILHFFILKNCVHIAGRREIFQMVNLLKSETALCEEFSTVHTLHTFLK